MKLNEIKQEKTKLTLGNIPENILFVFDEIFSENKLFGKPLNRIYFIRNGCLYELYNNGFGYITDIKTLFSFNISDKIYIHKIHIKEVFYEKV